MNIQLNPYIGFKDNAREAMEFYKGIFGGTLVTNTFKELHATEDPAEGDKIMHSMLTADNGMVFMASDTPNGMAFTEDSRISMSLSGDDDEELSGYFQKLSEGGAIRMPLEAAPWGDKFGMVTDKFGISWMVNISAKKAE